MVRPVNGDRRRAAASLVAAGVAALWCLVFRGTAPAADEPDAVATRDIVRDDSDPSLRLDLAGHTGDVLALAFFPDGTRLVSGGRDKVALVWSLADAAAAAPGTGVMQTLERARLRERALRWQVQRATRGAIQALAVSADDAPLVALAGNGAMGSTGEILLVKAADGTHVKTLGGGDRVGHRQAVNAVDFTADGAWLVSRDLDGQVFAWERGNDWRPVELAATERALHGLETEQELREFASQRPVVALGTGAVAFSTLANQAELADARAKEPADAPKKTPWIPRWRVRVVDLVAPGRPARDLPEEHLAALPALAATPDGRWLASAARDGTVFVRDPAGADPAGNAARPLLQLADGAHGTALALSPDGARLAIGVNSKSEPRVELWDVAPARRVAVRAVVGGPSAVRSSRDGTWLAWNGGGAHEVFVERMADIAREGTKPVVLGGVGTTITALAFDRPGAWPAPPEPATRDITRTKKPVGPPLGTVPRRLAIATWPVKPGGAAAAPPAAQPTGERVFDRAFDIEALAPIPPDGGPATGAWAPAAGVAAGWTLDKAKAPPLSKNVERWQLRRAGGAGGFIDLEREWQGRGGATAVSWLSRPGQAEPWGVALGTDRGIGVYRISAAADTPCGLVRWFRGHEGTVTSVAVSGDGQWLASGGRDGLVMLWSLVGIERPDAPLHARFGVDLAVDGGRLVVKAVEPAGPLAGRDVRVGDTIDSVSWGGQDADGIRKRAEPAAILEALSTVPFSAQVAFQTSRDGARRPLFQRMPAWENLAALHLAADGEWAFWTPRGYYAASANGDTLFGWLVNRGLDKLPHFYKAQQFRRRLERPDVMGRLLEAGSLDAALRATKRDVPESSAIVLPRAVAAAPTVRIVAPLPGAVSAAPTIDVEAEVEIPAGVEVDRVRVYSSGAVAASEPRVVEERAADAGAPRMRRYRWEGVRLPADTRHLLQVFAGTREGSTDVAAVEIAVPAPAVPVPRGRLFVLCAGVDRYPQGREGALFKIPDLRYSVADARSVHERLIGADDGPLAIGHGKLLADPQVTRGGWKDATRQLADACQAAGVGPDDLLVIFMAGHGIINGGREREYLFLCHDLQGGAVGLDDAGQPVVRPDDGIAWRDFADLERIPCRKLVLVDSCHSGGLGRESRGDAVREFQENMIVVVAAAADDQSSLESPAWGHGAFTKSLLEALGGAADGGTGDPADGVVSLHEVIDYTLENVPRLAEGVQNRGAGAVIRRQNPTVSPKALVPYVRMPLSKAAPAAR